LGLLPSEPAQLVELRTVSFGSGITLDEIQPLDWNIETRAFRIGEEHELAHITASALETGGYVSGRPAGGCDLNQTLKLTDAVVYVDDEVTDFQIPEVR